MDVQSGDVDTFLSPQLVDPARLHPLADLGQGLDYLVLEDESLNALPGAQTALPSRGWSDDLCYGTGVTYLTALGFGGAWGAAEGLRRQPLGRSSFKLALNATLNSITRRGPFLGNSAGVLAMTYNGANSFIGHMRGKHELANGVVAGGVAGALWKSTRGLRPMATAGAITATTAALWGLGKTWVM